AGVFLFTTGCVNRSGQPDNSATTASHSKDPQDFFVVDCLLPGEVRQLGQTFTFLAPRRAIKTTAFDCGLRGGEFTAYDRANYKTALSVWLPQAQQGDPEAQTYVGEIYEKGLGVAPDYAVAANWYAKASEQGSPRAQINLGYLYEKGLGVDQDVPKALNLYRNASGLTDDNLTFESTVEIETQARIGEARKEIEALRRNFQKSRLEAEKLRSKLASYESRLSTQRNRLDEALDELEKTRRDTKLLESTPSKDPQSSRTLEQQKEQLAKAQSHVLEERNRVKRLEQQFQRETTSLSTRLEATETKTDAYRQEILQSQPVRSQAYTVDATMLKKRQEEARTLTAKHTKAANDLRNQIYQGLDDLEAAQHQLASVQEDPSPRKQVISEYQIEIDKKQAGVLLQRAKLTKLETRYRAELKALKAEISLLERSQGLFADIGSQNFDHLPKITLLDPSLSGIKTRGRNHLAVKLRSVSSSHEILGRAEAFAGIKTLRLNNRALAIDDSAVFKT
ncbi:MAG: hypothetical protein NZ777_01900, partial [Pseudomonadales bacterium]|nr:hypothetical protein [Pseudomonadales bacterium]